MILAWEYGQTWEYGQSGQNLGQPRLWAPLRERRTQRVCFGSTCKLAGENNVRVARQSQSRQTATAGGARDTDTRYVLPVLPVLPVLLELPGTSPVVLLGSGGRGSKGTTADPFHSNLTKREPPVGQQFGFTGGVEGIAQRGDIARRPLNGHCEVLTPDIRTEVPIVKKKKAFGQYPVPLPAQVPVMTLSGPDLSAYRARVVRWVVAKLLKTQ